MAETRVICPECGKKVSLRGLNGHLRFDHDYNLENAKKMAAGFNVDGELSRLEQDVMEQVTKLYHLKGEAEDLRRARKEGVIGEASCAFKIAECGGIIFIPKLSAILDSGPPRPRCIFRNCSLASRNFCVDTSALPRPNSVPE